MVLLRLVPEHLWSSGLAGVCGCPSLLRDPGHADIFDAFRGVFHTFQQLLHGLCFQEALQASSLIRPAPFPHLDVKGKETPQKTLWSK